MTRGGAFAGFVLTQSNRQAALCFQAFGDHGEAAEADAGGIEDGVADGRSETHDGRFSGACGRQILAVKQNNFDFGNVAEARHATARKSRIGDAAILELDGFKERAIAS